jgi:formylmethanofuran dehydrogenase subunit B
MNAVHEHVTCLGCGLSCDDLTVTTENGRITDVRNGCDLGRAWFGNGVVPDEVRSRDQPVTLEHALADAAQLLGSARRPLVYLAPELSVDAQRTAVAIADQLRAVLDSSTSLAAEQMLASQRRGRIGATLGEIRRHADLIAFWGVDPTEHWPRYVARVVNPDNVPTLVAVDVGSRRGLSLATLRFSIERDLEVAALGVVRAAVIGRAPLVPDQLRPFVDLAQRMLRATYVVLVHDSESSESNRDPDRFEALIALAQALNGPTRAALSSLTAGGNRAGAAQVLAWQTGFPMAVDFGSGSPEYRPDEIVDGQGWDRELDAVLIAGDPGSLPPKLVAVLSSVPTVFIGPRASAARVKPTVVVDTGVPGIHEAGMAFRMDDVPLPLTAMLADSPRSTTGVLGALLERLGTMR